MGDIIDGIPHTNSERDFMPHEICGMYTFVANCVLSYTTSIPLNDNLISYEDLVAYNLN